MGKPPARKMFIYEIQADNSIEIKPSAIFKIKSYLNRFYYQRPLFLARFIFKILDIWHK